MFMVNHLNGFGAGGAETDPYFSSVVLLAHMDGTDASTTFTDVKGHTLTAVGNAQIDTAQSKFGGASGLFDAAADYVSSADSADWNLGSGDFTIEAWVRFNTTATDKTIVSQFGASGNRGWNLHLKAGPSLSLQYTTDGSTLQYIDNSWSPSTGQWYHAAMSKSGTNTYMFIDGTQIGTTQTLSGTLYNSTIDLNIGGYNNGAGGFWDGWIDELRITKGVARYTANFTAPSAPFPDE